MRRVSEYLKMLGLADGERLEWATELISSGSWHESAEQHARQAIQHAQELVDAWQDATFADLPQRPDPAWLRAFLSTHPRAFLAEPSEARALSQTFGDPATGTPPVVTPFVRQSFGRPRLPAWLRGLIWPTIATTLATTVLAVRLLDGGARPLELAWLGLFALLFGHAALGFFTALRGFRTERPSELVGYERADEETSPAEGEPPRTAVVLPVYHENATDVFAGVAAMRESLLRVADAPPIEMFVLSDSQDPLVAAEEERAHRRVTAYGNPEVPIYYRRRARNVGQKAGNLAEFFQRWGDRYDYVIVLDADSLMQGTTMVELIRRIHRAERVALLQAPIVPIRGRSLLARALQWSTTVAGPLFARGLMRWSGAHGNYYGHNAILRTRAFLECCALPTLAGRPPLGGPLLSHDFVEAALLCRGDFQVRSATDLAGSYEELPATLAEYVARDRRWCQGNLQHLRVFLSPGIPAMSRLHLLFGATAYLAGPIWVVFTCVGTVLAAQGRLNLSLAAAGLALVLALLIGPRVLGVIAVARTAADRTGHGGLGRLAASFVTELGLSALLGPLLMLHHARMVVSITLGRAVTWGAVRRGSKLAAPLRGELTNTAIGLALAFGLTRAAPEQALWLAPVWVPLLLAIPTSLVLSSTRVGPALQRLGLLLVPSEVKPDPLCQRADELRMLTEGDSAGRFRDLVLDPVLVSAHLKRLEASASTPSTGSGLCERALRVGPAGLSERERKLLLGDAESLRWLHREAWRAWPTETWELGRHVRQLPSDER